MSSDQGERQDMVQGNPLLFSFQGDNSWYTGMFVRRDVDGEGKDSKNVFSIYCTDSRLPGPKTLGRYGGDRVVFLPTIYRDFSTLMPQEIDDFFGQKGLGGLANSVLNELNHIRDNFDGGFEVDLLNHNDLPYDLTEASDGPKVAREEFVNVPGFGRILVQEIREDGKPVLTDVVGVAPFGVYPTGDGEHVKTTCLKVPQKFYAESIRLVEEAGFYKGVMNFH